MKLSGGRESKEKKSEYHISNHTHELVWRGLKALGSLELEQGAGETGQGGRRGQTGLRDGDCRKEMQNP